MSDSRSLLPNLALESVVPFNRAHETGPVGLAPSSRSQTRRASPEGEPAARNWFAALDAVARAAHVHEARLDELRELEGRVLERVKRLEGELRQSESRAATAEKKAQEAERRAAEAEEWLQRMYDKIHEHFGVRVR